MCILETYASESVLSEVNPLTKFPGNSVKGCTRKFKTSLMEANLLSSGWIQVPNSLGIQSLDSPSGSPYLWDAFPGQTAMDSKKQV